MRRVLGRRLLGRRVLERLVQAALISLTVFAPSVMLAQCTDRGIALQILGSGGPFGDGRASSGYVLWVDGSSRILIDAGGGVFSRFHEAGASIEDLQLVALSHFHPDHAAELPALLWPRNGTLRIAGPTGNTGFPSLTEFLDGLVGPEGVFRVLAPRFQFQSSMIDTGAGVGEVLDESFLHVTALGVPHGDVPTLAYRVDYQGASFVFSSDQTGGNPAFVDFARGADVLVVHFAGAEYGTGPVAELHARPSVWGQIASQAEVGRLVLSHITVNQDLEANMEVLRDNYHGLLTLGQDLLCILP
ncbi:MAG: MBL fold metallo-hydrolase [Gammaproteobacteria bacterium]|nr:MBL fold metallo-hydrolase [Pseudomonadales bacterium]MCP5348709.1 MBL fold metallo-hydrolase [Pseudomonadales bacterium]